MISPGVALLLVIFVGTGVNFMYQQAFNPELRHHAYLSGFFSNSAAPDVIVGIVRCVPRTAGQGYDQSGGYAYLSLVDEQWKFHIP